VDLVLGDPSNVLIESSNGELINSFLISKTKLGFKILNDLRREGGDRAAASEDTLRYFRRAEP